MSVRIGSTWKKFRDLGGVLVRKQGFRVSSNKGRFISLVLDQFYCIVVKHGNLLFWIRQGCMG